MKIKNKILCSVFSLIFSSFSVQAVEKTDSCHTDSQKSQYAVDMLRKAVSKSESDNVPRSKMLGFIIDDLIKQNQKIDQKLSFLRNILENEEEVKKQLRDLVPDEGARLVTQAWLKELERLNKLFCTTEDNAWITNVRTAHMPMVYLRTLKKRMDQEFDPQHVRKLMGMLGLCGWHQLDFLPEIINPVIKILTDRMEQTAARDKIPCLNPPESGVIEELMLLRDGICKKISSLQGEEFEKGMIEYFWNDNPEMILKWMSFSDQWQSADHCSVFFSQDDNETAVWTPSQRCRGIFGPTFWGNPDSLELMKHHFLTKLFDTPEKKVDVHFFIRMISPTYGAHTTLVTTTPQGLKFIDSHADRAPRIMKDANQLLEALLASIFGTHPYCENIDRKKESLFWFFPKNEQCNPYEHQIMVDCLTRELHDENYFAFHEDDTSGTHAKCYSITTNNRERFYTEYFYTSYEKYCNQQR